MSEAMVAPGFLVGGRYRLERELGHGGMGSVWSARHVVTRRAVAMKFLRSSLTSDPEMHRRFLREARAASAVQHPNVIDVYDVFDLEDETPVIVMALLEGETLGRRLAREAPLSLSEAAEVMLPVVSALGTAHSVGVIHRDLKPDNVFLAQQGAEPLIQVLDFGIAKVASTGGAAEGDTLTAAGRMLGTPCYMAPEQGFGEPDVDHRADIWAIGAILYEALSGARPVEGENLGQVLQRFTRQGITPIAALVSDLPEEVSKLITRMLARSREQRPQDLREVLAVLSRYASVEVPAFQAPSAAPRELWSPSQEARPESPAASGSVRADPGAARAPETQNLPVSITPFVGRAEELTELERLLSDPVARLVTMVAPGGMGKSRLAVEAARRMVEGLSEAPEGSSAERRPVPRRSTASAHSSVSHRHSETPSRPSARQRPAWPLSWCGEKRGQVRKSWLVGSMTLVRVAPGPW